MATKTKENFKDLVAREKETIREEVRKHFKSEQEVESYIKSHSLVIITKGATEEIGITYELARA